MNVADASSARFDLYYTPGFIPAFRHGGSGPGYCTNEEKALGAGFNIGYLDGHAAFAPWPEWLDWRLNYGSTTTGKYSFR
jgi:prepilin-type processing-associated H-X9-DG protein